MPIIRQDTLYTSTASVAVRLANKVQFQQDPNRLDNGQLPNEFFLQLIQDAETQVENDLRGRYAIPFRSKRTLTFAGLPDHSRRSIRMVVDMKAAAMVLANDFGGGSHLDSDVYTKNITTLYDAEIKKLLGMDQEGEKRGRYRFSPPLDDMMLACGNSEADDGFKGSVISNGEGYSVADYAANQINDPSLGWTGVPFRGRR